MSDEGEERQVAEEVETGEEDDEERQEDGEGKGGDGSPVTVDSAVAAFFSPEGGSEKGSVGSSKGDDANSQAHMVAEEWSSDGENEARARPSDSGQTAAEIHAALDVARKSPADHQQAVAGAGAVSPAEAEREDSEEEVDDIDPAQSASAAQRIRDGEDHHVATPDDSAEEDVAQGEGEERAQQPLSATAAPPPATEAAAGDDGHITSHEEESKDIQDETQELSEPGNGNTVGGLTDPSDGRQERVRMVAQDLDQHELDTVIVTDTDEQQAAEAGQQDSGTKTFSELDRVDLNSEDWGSEGQGGTSPPPDDALLSDAEVDREQDADRLPSDSEQLPEGDGDLRDAETGSSENDAETGSSENVQPCEGERELQGESQQLYQYVSDDHGRSPASFPHSQGDVRSLQGTTNRPEHGQEVQRPLPEAERPLPEAQRPSPKAERPSLKAEYPLNVDNYRVCRMLSPGVKECLILETGEQVMYDCATSSRGRVPSATAAQPYSPVSSSRDKVKRNLFSGGFQDSGDRPGIPSGAQVGGEVGSPRDLSFPPGPSLSQQQQQYRSTAQDHPSARDRTDRPRGEAEESCDGSYLWLQRQTQWRAGSSEVPVVRSSRESSRADRHTTSPSSGYRMHGRGDNNLTSSRQEVSSGESRRGVSELTGLTDLSGSVTSPGAIPNFNTLRDQQVSWLSMYRMLEEQHRSELQAQYQEHQQMIVDMQRQLEGELLSQQNTMRQKLDSHRQALKETSSYLEYSRNQGGAWYSKHNPLEERDTLPPSDPSQHRESTAWSSRDNLRSPPEISREKRLRGGVYSSPMPTAKFRASGRERYSCEEGSQEPSYTSERRSQQLEKEVESDSRPPSGQILSPRTHQSLREKHAKHLSDLRSYYEAEIQDLRQKLSTEVLRPPSSSAAGAHRDSTRERLLQEETQMLRLQLRDLQDSLDDAQIYSRDLEQKIQGLEIRAADYCKRYEESQSTVLKLKNRLEELHTYAKDRESVLEQAQANERRQAAMLQEMVKAKEELEETARRDNSTIKRLLDKYDMLEKDYSALKETCADFEQKLFDTRSEAVQLNKVISQLELENKRLTHDNDNMRHRLAISGSLPLSRQELAETGQHRGDYGKVNGHAYDSQVLALSQNSARSRDVTPPPPRSRGLSDEDEDNDNCISLGQSDSPLLRAERELRRLQQTLDHGEFIPRLQHKKYASSSGSLGPAGGEVTIIDAFSSPTRSTSGTSVDGGAREGTRRVKKPVSTLAGKRERPVSGGQGMPGGAGRSPQKSDVKGNSGSSVASPTRFDVGVSQTGARSPASGATSNKGGRNQEGKKDPKLSAPKTSSEDSRRVDATLERVRSGEFVARPQWEDLYTSLAKPPQSDKSPSINMTQEEMLRDRIRSIDQLERRYDLLQVEKRKLESQLNKVPAHGRDRKSRREKELLEEKLDSVDHELGSLRMTLKRYQVLKTTM